LSIELSPLMETLGATIEELKTKNINEAQTKEWLIRPFFEGLGWDFSNFKEVIPELSDQAGKRPDYSFRINSKTKLLLEVKTLSDPLTDQRMIIEKLNYCGNLDVPLLVITNGDLYRIYYSQLKGIGKDKLLAEFAISGEWDESLVLKLSRQAFAEDELVTYAEDLFILTNIKDAVETMLALPPRRFINDVNEIVKSKLGHKFGTDEVRKALSYFSVDLNQEQLEIEEDEEKEEPIAGTWTVADQFKGDQWTGSRELYDRLLEKLKAKGIDFMEKPTKLYVGLWTNNRSFCQIHGQKRGLKMWINLEMEDLSEQEVLLVRDVSGTGHWGMGDIECTFRNITELDKVAAIIKKAYQKANL
jgi:predicted transport protein